jgi:hypothetical protein
MYGNTIVVHTAVDVRLVSRQLPFTWMVFRDPRRKAVTGPVKDDIIHLVTKHKVETVEINPTDPFLKERRVSPHPPPTVL